MKYPKPRPTPAMREKLLAAAIKYKSVKCPVTHPKSMDVEPEVKTNVDYKVR